MDLGLQGKNALVTGASHGIGRSISLALAREGCNVAICARGASRIRETVKEIENAGVMALGISCDVLKESDIKRTVDKVVKKWKSVHVLINNVGGGGRWGSPEIEMTDEKIWTDVYAKNALAAMRFTVLMLPIMRKQKWGRIVTVSSISGREGGARPWFAMAKNAEIVLMKTLAMTPYLARDNITFNSVAPGAIMIPDTGWEKEKKRDLKGFNRKVNAGFPLGRLGNPEEVADVVAFLCSRQASLVNGACITIDGAESRSF